MKQIKLINLVLSEKAGKEIVCGVSDKEKVIIGRNYDSDIVIPEDYSDVSRIHCVIYQREREVTIEDTSKNGTYVNGKELTKGEESPLNHGDKLKLAGICELEVKIGEEEDLKLETKPKKEDSGPEFEIDA